MLTCSRIAAIRGSNKLFSDLGFTLFNGSCLLIKGRNGSGKTTLLKIIANLVEKKSGDIFFNEINIKLALQEYVQLISFLDNTEILNQESTILENLTFWSDIHNNRISIDAALRIFSLQSFINKKVRELSRGMKQKVLLSLLILHNSKIWLLDEPFNSLDKDGVSILVNMIKARCSQQGIVIIATNENHPLIEGACEILIEDFKC